MADDRDSPIVLEDGDAAEVLRAFADESFDSMVTDPPGGIRFMERDWDTFAADGRSDRDVFVEQLTLAMREALRVLKPGAYGLVWAIPRTSHWTAWACEDAGFEVRDRVSHLFGQGFPKSRNLDGGRGTALKPAVEDWWLVRKPLVGTVDRNVAQYGTGALNIDACRVGSGDGGTRQGETTKDTRYTNRGTTNFAALPGPRGGASDGRWPANLVLSCGCPDAAHLPVCPVALLDAQSGTLHTHAGSVKANHAAMGYGGAKGSTREVVASSGGASRFYYCAKASRAEKEAGLDHRIAEIANDGRETAIDNPYQRGDTLRLNPHPTVKSVELMRWLVRLVTPLGGRVLDLFCGTGTTGIACVLEGFRFLGIDNDPDTLDIAFDRIEHWYYEQHPERRPA